VIENAIQTRWDVYAVCVGWVIFAQFWHSCYVQLALQIDIIFVTDLDCIVVSKLSVIHGSVRRPVNFLHSSLIIILQ